MRTTKPFSSIFHGTEPFLRMSLDSLVKDGYILFWAYIRHHKEEDEEKDHWHIYAVPDGRFDTDNFITRLTELDMTNPKPIKPLPCRSSRFDDWYLYNTHDSRYLASKGQYRKYHYSREDFVTSERDYFIEMIHHIDFSKINRLDVIIRAVETGETFDSLVASGQVPVPLLNQYKQAYSIMYNALLSRNGRDTHE